MKSEIFIVKVPQLGANENKATLVEWHITDSGNVSIGDVICSLETTKAVFDVEADVEGYVAHLADIGEELSVSDSLALIINSADKLKEEKRKYLSKIESDIISQQSKKGSVKATKKAAELAFKLNVNLEDIVVDGILKEKDVENFAVQKDIIKDNNNIEEIIDLIGNRKIGKELMLDSVNNIPHSYIERIVVVNNVEEKVKEFIHKEGTLITMLSIIICALAKALKKNKIFNAYRDKDKIMVYSKINVGVVIAHNNNITIPVIKDADKLTPVEIVKLLMNIRKDIIKRKPNVEDLIDGTITVSAMDHTDVSRFVPIIHPKQAAVLAIPKMQTRNEIDEKGLVSNNKYVNLGMSFDHSFLDANQANAFLGSLIEEMSVIVNTL